MPWTYHHKNPKHVGTISFIDHFLTIGSIYIMKKRTQKCETNLAIFTSFMKSAIRSTNIFVRPVCNWRSANLFREKRKQTQADEKDKTYLNNATQSNLDYDHNMWLKTKNYRIKDSIKIKGK